MGRSSFERRRARKLSHPCGKHMGDETAARFGWVELTKLSVQRHKVVGAGSLTALALHVNSITEQAVKRRIDRRVLFQRHTLNYRAY